MNTTHHSKRDIIPSFENKNAYLAKFYGPIEKQEESKDMISNKEFAPLIISEYQSNVLNDGCTNNCINNSVSILIVDDNDFNIYSLQTLLQITFGL